MKAQEIKKGIHFVGAVDWNCRNFHGYSLSPKGTTYNAFLVQGSDKTALIDTVKEDFTDTLACSIAHVTKLEKVDYIVANHIEPDHSGALPRMVEMIKPEKIFVSPMGERAVKTYYDTEGWPLEVVPTGSEISLGGKTLQFVETRMLHWPDNMLTYIPEDKIAFTSDAFGQNWATSERFVDQVCRTTFEQLLSDYYANIVLPYSSKVISVLDDLEKMNLDIDMLCPDHGLIYRGDDVKLAFESYRRFANQVPKRKAVIVFDTMWHSTEKMAKAIASGLESEDVSVRLMAVKQNHHSDVMNEVMDAAAVIVGSPTHNNGILPGMAGMLTYMKGLRPQNKIGAVFGSFGWSGECVKILTGWLESMKMELPVDPVKVKNRPTHDTYGQCFDLGKKIGQAVKEKTG